MYIVSSARERDCESHSWKQFHGRTHRWWNKNSTQSGDSSTLRFHRLRIWFRANTFIPAKSIRARSKALRQLGVVQTLVSPRISANRSALWAETVSVPFLCPIGQQNIEADSSADDNLSRLRQSMRVENALFYTRRDTSGNTHSNSVLGKPLSTSATLKERVSIRGSLLQLAPSFPHAINYIKSVKQTWPSGRVACPSRCPARIIFRKLFSSRSIQNSVSKQFLPESFSLE